MVNEDELNFESEFQSDDEVDETLDEFINYIAEMGSYREQQVHMVNLPKMKNVVCVYKILKYLLRGSNAKVTYELNKPFINAGSVTVVGKKITFRRPEWFIVSVMLASNFNVYPKTDGTVQMDFTFYGLTTNIA